MSFSGWPFKKRNKDADKSDHLPVQPVLTLDQKYSSGLLQVTDLEFDFDKIDYKRQVGMIRQALDNSLLQGYPDDEVLSGEVKRAHDRAKLTLPQPTSRRQFVGSRAVWGRLNTP
ncbi:MAG: hypothetical protein KGQ59_11985 [Bdellovibrionales bacterium]|nr:hypothetical protein [Bdellovibrionales bacterium]